MSANLSDKQLITKLHYLVDVLRDDGYLDASNLVGEAITRLQEKGLQVTKLNLQKTLHSNEATVTFTKADGSERVMRCTLVESKLPPRSSEESTKKPNDEVMCVFDLDKNEFRSFRLDSIKSISVG